MLYLGCPMWGLKAWTGTFFPKGARSKDFLALYSRRLTTVEGNTTFYATPASGTVERWRDATPPGFQFCLKFPQSISHQKRLRQAETETAEFLQRLEVLGDRCGVSFLQLPPTFTGQQLPALAAYLKTLPRTFRYAVEPRHADFFGGPAEAAFDELLRTHGVARVIFDTTPLFSLPAAHSPAVQTAQSRKPKFPPRYVRTADFVFVRFVGQPEVAANARWLDVWAEHVARWLAEGVTVYFFAHSPDDVFSPYIARAFHERVTEHWPLPPLPEWEDAPPRQASLF